MLISLTWNQRINVKNEENLMTTCYQKGNWEVNINQKHPLEEGIKLREDVNLLSLNEETTLLSPKGETTKRLILSIISKTGDKKKVNLKRDTNLKWIISKKGR